MAQRAETLGPETESFLVWLREICDQGGLTAGKLQRLLVRQGWDVTPESTRRWLRGERVPPAGVVPFLLRALAEVLPKAEVDASYRRWAQISYFRKNSHDGDIGA
jgi:hypothetical protein